MERLQRHQTTLADDDWIDLTGCTAGEAIARLMAATRKKRIMSQTPAPIPPESPLSFPVEGTAKV